MRTLAGIVTTAVLAGCATHPEPEPRPLLSLEEVLTLHESGVAPKVIVAKIQTSDVTADMPVRQIIELKQKGLPDDVLEALVRATEAEPLPSQVIVRRYGPSYWDPWYYRHPYVY